MSEHILYNLERDVIMDKNTLNKLLEEKKLAETLIKDESFKKRKKILALQIKI